MFTCGRERATVPLAALSNMLVGSGGVNSRGKGRGMSSRVGIAFGEPETSQSGAGEAAVYYLIDSAIRKRDREPDQSVYF